MKNRALLLLLCMLTIPVAAQQGAPGRRGGGPPAPRPNMLDDARRDAETAMVELDRSHPEPECAAGTHPPVHDEIGGQQNLQRHFAR